MIKTVTDLKSEKMMRSRFRVNQPPSGRLISEWCGKLDGGDGGIRQEADTMGDMGRTLRGHQGETDHAAGRVSR